MKMESNLEKEIKNILGSIESLSDIKPMIEVMLPEIEPFIERSRSYIIGMRAKSIKQLMSEYEFTFEQSIEVIKGMTTESIQSVTDTMKG